MKFQLKRSFINSLRHFSFYKGKSCIKIPLIIPYHHLIGEKTPDHVKHIYTFKSSSEFESDLLCLMKYYRSIDLEDLLAGSDPPQKSFLLTFDDGCREVYENVLPILKKYNLKAVFFLNSSFLDNKEMYYKHALSVLIEKIINQPFSIVLEKTAHKLLDDFNIPPDDLIDRLKKIDYQKKDIVPKLCELFEVSIEEYLIKNKPYLESWQVREMISLGHYVGGHSKDHPMYADISFEEQVAQTIDSVKYLVDRFNLNYRIFSIPHVDDGIGEKFFTEVLENNEYKIDLIFGNSNLKKEAVSPRVLHRIIGENPYLNWKGFLNAHILYNWLLTKLGRNLIVR